MALPNLSGSNIQDTYQRVLQKAGTNYYDGTGSAFITSDGGSQPDNSGVLVYNPNGNVGGKLIADSGFTYTGTVLSAQCETINFTAASTGINLIGSITASGDISASGDIIARNIIPEGNPTAGLRLNSTSTSILSNLFVSGSVTASGDISASGNIYVGAPGYGKKVILQGTIADGNYIYGNGANTVSTAIHSINKFNVHSTGISVGGAGSSPIGNITASGNISASGTITGNTASFSSIIGTLTSPSQTNIASVGHSVTVGTLDRKITLTGGSSFGIASRPSIAGGNSSFISFTTGISLPDIQKLTFGSNLYNTYIAANGDQPEDLLIHANEDIILNPDNQVIVNSNISSSGTITATSFIGTMDGGSF